MRCPPEEGGWGGLVLRAMQGPVVGPGQRLGALPGEGWSTPLPGRCRAPHRWPRILQPPRGSRGYQGGVALRQRHAQNLRATEGQPAAAAAQAPNSSGRLAKAMLNALGQLRGLDGCPGLLVADLQIGVRAGASGSHTPPQQHSHRRPGWPQHQLSWDGKTRLNSTG